MVAKRHQFFKSQVLPPEERKKNIVQMEQEKRIQVSDSGNEENESSQDPSQIEDDSYSIRLGNKNSLFFNPKASNMDRGGSEEEKKSNLNSNESSFNGTDKERNSVATFHQHNSKLLKGFEQSEIAKKQAPETEMTSTIRGAFNQVSSIVEAHEFRFQKEQHKNKDKSNKSRSKRNQDLVAHNTIENESKLFQIVQRQADEGDDLKVLDLKRKTERNKNGKSHSRKKNKSNFSEVGHLYLVKDKNKAPSEYRKLEPMEVDSPSERRESFNRKVAQPSNLDDDFI